MSWFLEALKFIESREGFKYLTGAALGAVATFGLTWRREHRRSLDTYRAPQRQAISDILAANFDFQARELELRMEQLELFDRVAHLQQGFIDDSGPGPTPAAKAAATAGHALNHAFAIGRLTIVDAPCWEALGAAFFEFERLRALKINAPGFQNADDVTAHYGALASRAAQLNSAVSALVVSAADRLSPAETLINPWRRRRGRRRLEQLFRQSLEADAGQPAVAPPAPH
jgi:hypothetical protein